MSPNVSELDRHGGKHCKGGTGQRRCRTHIISKQSGLKGIAKSVGWNNSSGIAREVMKNSRIRKKVLEVTIHNIQKEMTVLCSTKIRS